MYNMDKKGFMLGIAQKGKRVFSRLLYNQGLVEENVQDGNRDWISVVACICADGLTLPPACIYESSSGNIQASWVRSMHEHPLRERPYIAASDNGWTTNELGRNWIETVFNKHTKEKAGRSWRLLILDGHGSHTSMEFLQYAISNRILVVILPSYSTHTLQPLDVVMFSPLAKHYSTGVEYWIFNTLNTISMTKADFYNVFLQAWKSTFQPKLVL